MQNFFNGFAVWFNSRKTKTFLIVALTALLGYVNHSVSPEQALNTILAAGIACLAGVTAEDVAAKIGAGRTTFQLKTSGGADSIPAIIPLGVEQNSIGG